MPIPDLEEFFPSAKVVSVSDVDNSANYFFTQKAIPRWLNRDCFKYRERTGNGLLVQRYDFLFREIKFCRSNHFLFSRLIMRGSNKNLLCNTMSEEARSDHFYMATERKNLALKLYIVNHVKRYNNTAIRLTFH